MKRVVVLASYAESLINFRYHLLKSMVEKGNKVIAFAPDADKDVIAKLQEIGVVYEPIALNRTGNNPIQDFMTFGSLLKLFYRYRPDALLSYTIKPVIYGSLAARIAKVQSINSMITGLGSVFTSGKETFISKIIKWLYGCALRVNDKIFFQNQDDYQELVEQKILKKSQKVTFINGSGVDLDYFSQTPAIRTPIAFLLIARLIRDKGIVEYISAAKIIKEKYSDVIFYLVGPFDTNPTALSVEEVNKWEDEGAIKYLGKKDDVRGSIAKASVYVLPSYREGTPRSVLEAMSMGKPVITTDAPGCRETVINGKNGFLVPVKNVDELVEAMEEFISDPEIIVEMGNFSRQIAEEKYNVHDVNNIIMNTLSL